MLLVTTLALLAASQSAQDPARYFGFLWSLADGCYEHGGGRGQTARRVCLRREGDALRMRDHERWPRFEHRSECVARMREDGRILFSCVGRGTAVSGRPGRLEGDLLVFDEDNPEPPLRTREIWRRTDFGIEVRIHAMNRYGEWRPFGAPHLLAGLNYWRLARVDEPVD